ncbi:hypothetical protein [Prochlorothrix hollandica]|uniref:hypothetical protein n=1 Tax=Prochlorothrix hollandica TaxID=1223 RepID=UPI00334036CC
MDPLNRVRQLKHRSLEFLDHRWRYVKQSWQKPDLPINDRELRLMGLRRSGNHAILGWIRLQYPTYAWHINHPPSGQNPYRFLHRHFPKPELASEAQGKFSPKAMVILSYEDKPLTEICSPHFERFHDVYVGSSARRWDVLILRDPFNLMASRLKSQRSILHSNARADLQLWLAYAQEFLGETQVLTQPRVCLNFNRWNTDRDYRQQLAQQLDLTFTDAGRERVKNYGGGSSFDGTDFSGQASQMNLGERWRIFEHDRDFWDLFAQDQLLDCTERIFGRDDLPFDRV